MDIRVPIVPRSLVLKIAMATMAVVIRPLVFVDATMDFQVPIVPWRRVADAVIMVFISMQVKAVLAIGVGEEMIVPKNRVLEIAIGTGHVMMTAPVLVKKGFLDPPVLIRRVRITAAAMELAIRRQANALVTLAFARMTVLKNLAVILAA